MSDSRFESADSLDSAKLFILTTLCVIFRSSTTSFSLSTMCSEFFDDVPVCAFQVRLGNFTYLHWRLNELFWGSPPEAVFLV